MIDPLYGGKSADHILQIMLDEPDVSPMDAVHDNWKDVLGGAGKSVNGDVVDGDAGDGDADLPWRKALHDGWIANTAFAPKEVSAKNTALLRRPCPMRQQSK